MAEALVLEFEGNVGQAEYDKVNGLLGIDPTNKGSDWPDGLLTHAAGPTDAGWIVIETWESRAANEAFMASRLGAALGEAGVPAPTRATWSTLVANTTVAG